MNADDWLCGLQNCYALVAYLPDPLAGFLNNLTRSLVPGSNPHAHVTLMPPSRLADNDQALQKVQQYFSHVPPFELEAAALNVFPSTNVIFLEIGHGRERLIEIFGDLNCGASSMCPQYPYHPHITVAQDLPAAGVPEALERAKKAWAEYPYRRRFTVHELSFVKNTNNNWEDLAKVTLGQPVVA